MAETPAPALENNATPPATAPAPAAPVNAVDSAELERLKKEAEQAKMRAAQLENEKAARDKAEAEARQKQLEEQEQWKTIAQEAQAKAEALEREKADAENKARIAAASEETLKDYPDQVKTIAQTTGLTLSDDSDAAKADFKAKLDAIAQTVGAPTPSVTPNNPPTPAPTTRTREELVARSGPGAKSIMAEAAANGDETPLYEYLRQSPAVQRFKEIGRGNIV